MSRLSAKNLIYSMSAIPPRESEKGGGVLNTENGAGVCISPGQVVINFSQL